MAIELYSEDFSGTGALGAAWEATSSLGLKVVSDNAVASGSSQVCTSCITTAEETFPPDQYAEIILTTFSENDYPGVCVRGTNGFNGYYVRAIFGEYRLWRVTGNSEVQSLGTTSGASPTSGDTLRIEAEGTEIRVYVNAVLEITATGESTYSSGQPGMFYWYGNNNLTLIDSFSAGNLSATAGPTFDDSFSPITSKIGQVYGVGTEFDISTYFTDPDTITYGGGATDLPAGMSIDSAGLITGTLPATAASYSCTVTATAGGDATDATFTWDYTDYSLVFSGTTKLLNTNNSPYNPATTVSFSAIKGTIDGGLAGTVYDWSAHTVTDGVPDPVLSDSGLTSGTWTVFAQDDSDPTILGIYEIVAE